MEQYRQSNSNLPMHVHDGDSSRLYWLLAILSAAGVVLIACSHLPQLHATLPGEILRDLGIAFCISVVIAVIIELSLSRHTFLRGIDAIMQRTVPADVWEDFRQHVITQQMMREGWSVTMTMVQTVPGRCVSTTNIKYTIVALQDVLRTHVPHEVDSHRTPPGSSRRYTRAKIGNHQYASHADLVGARLLSDDELTLQVPVELDTHDEKLPVELEFEELISCPDLIVWWMTRVTRNVTLTIKQLPESWSADVKTFHPAQRQLVRVNGANEWKFSGIMFPGQGIEIRIRSTC